jgi:hypothetical protein
MQTSVSNTVRPLAAKGNRPWASSAAPRAARNQTTHLKEVVVSDKQGGLVLFMKKATRGPFYKESPGRTDLANQRPGRSDK